MDDSLQNIDLSRPLAGSEGADANHASRIRVQTLLVQHASLVRQTQFADTKSGGLITVIGLLALNGPVPMTGMMDGGSVSLVAGVLSGLCILFCILTIFPRYPSRYVRAHLPDLDRFSWPALTSPDFGPVAHSEFMRQAEISQIIHSIALSNSAVSRILLRKFQMLRIAFVLGAADFALIFLHDGGLF